MTTQDTLANPIINSPYDEPRKHFVLGDNGPTGEIADRRRPSEFFIPVPKAKKGGKKQADAGQQLFDLNVTDEKIERNDAIDQLRAEVRTWRHRGYERVTPISKKLLLHWADPTRENRILFAQREAAETAVFLTEVIGRRDYTPSVGSADWRELLKEANDSHNGGLPRLALKMATGSGKTVVMAMLIAWQTLNKIASPHDARFVKRFVVVTPGITIRDRLGVLQPEHPENYYDQREVVPADLREQLGQAQIAIVNYHQFQAKDSMEIKGVSANTRKLLLGGKKVEDPFRETPQAIASRIMRKLGGGKGEIIVLNDEAHHCYQPNTTLSDANADLTSKPDAEMKAENEDATVWFKGLQYLKRHVGVKSIYDLSATPFYLKGSGWSEGLIFPWTVSDFSLMDAIESGIVKIPRLPVDDDAEGKQVQYLHLYDQVKDDPNWPRSAKAGPLEPGQWTIPAALEGALRSLYKSYEASFAEWESHLRDLGETPPVMIVVSPNTFVSKLIYDWIAGYEKQVGGEMMHVAGRLEKFSNVEGDRFHARPRTIIVDSRQLESDDAMKADFKEAAAEEIEAFKRQLREEGRGHDIEKLTDKDLLREVMNTVGKKGKLGEQVRCVVSVAMLTEGWDANTVTHILGIRAFGSQLLCEQVVGRGLRRRSYSADPETGFFGAEYSNIYGIPFAFIPSDKPVAPGKPADPPTRVEARQDRDHLRIDFPVLSGYRVELPEGPVWFDPEDADHLTIDGATVPTWVDTAGIVGAGERIEGIAATREQQLAFEIAGKVLQTYYSSDGESRPWMFPSLVEYSKQWMRNCVHLGHGYTIDYLSLAEMQQLAAEAVQNAITRQKDENDSERRPRLRPILRSFGASWSTDTVRFDTRKKTIETTHSHVSHVTLDGKDGNEWEKKVAKVCEGIAADGLITSYVKNDQLGFTIPYVHKGVSHQYLPDFLLKLNPRATVDAINPDMPRYLIVEVSGSQKSPGPTKEKARTARDSWCVAVNNHGGFGRWGYIELGKHGVDDADDVLRQAIRSLLRDEEIVGDPDLLNSGILAGISPRQYSNTEG
ncbi:BPTD_3080 family restriction endonuclease [Agromyces sp. NPDC056523]|uniref:BPTD_3080 family restriction endonuclease n=1 Tax=Agromyces sp. NPDC056523 TaxID=3345850 RepID=UPI00366B3F50